MNKFLVLTAVAGVFLSSSAAVRRLEGLTVVEGATASLRRLNASGVVSDNPTVAAAVLRDTDVGVTGLTIGQTEVGLQDAQGTFAACRVTVVPNYWHILDKMFRDNPEISAEIVGGRVLLVGTTASLDTQKLVKEAQALDPNRIFARVTYSTEAIGSLLKVYLDQIGSSNVTVAAVGSCICLRGRLYDQKSIDRITARAQEFLKPFESVGLNVDGLTVVKQRIILTAEFIQYDVDHAHNLGIEWPAAIGLEGTFSYGWDWGRKEGGNNSGSETYSGTSKFDRDDKSEAGKRTVTSTDHGSNDSSFETKLADSLVKNNDQSVQSKVTVSGLKWTINMLKQNDAAKSLYKTALATQSGEEVEFQNGGTLTVRLTGTFGAGETRNLEWGFLVKALPVILDENTVSLSLSLDNRTQPSTVKGSEDYELTRYQTKSKYIVRPGETIAMSGFNSIKEANTKKGMVFLSHIPLVGERLFGNDNKAEKKKEMLLLVTVDWATEDARETAAKRGEALREKSADVEMP